MVAMRSPIPPAIREELSNDPFMARCIIEGEECNGRIEWHHAFTYSGKRQNELWSILPMCHAHHMTEHRYKTKIVDVLIARIAHFAADADFRAKYPKSNLLPSKI